MSVFKEIAEALVEGDRDATLNLVIQALSEGAEPNGIIDEGLSVGIKQVGVLWEEGEFFLPELMQGAEIMKAAMDILTPIIAKMSTEAIATKGKVVIGTVAGDIHDIGKTLVASMLTAAGFQVIDLGADVSIDEFIDNATEHDADLICLSALLTTTMVVQMELIEELKKRGIRGKHSVLVGGAPVSKAWATQIDADGFAENAVAAVKKAEELMAERRAN